MASISVAVVARIAPWRERQPPRSDRDTHSDLLSVSCGRLLHVAAQSLCMNAGFFSHSPWSAHCTQFLFLSLWPAGHSSCRRGTAAGAVEGRGDDWRDRGLARSSRCHALSTGGGTRSSAARRWLSGCGSPTPPRAPRATALMERIATIHILRGCPAWCVRHAARPVGGRSGGDTADEMQISTYAHQQNLMP